MSQESETSQVEANSVVARRQRRQRNRVARPVLVTENGTAVEEPHTGALENETGPLSETNVVDAEPVESAPARKGVRLPRFFSKVAKEDQASDTTEDEVVKARLARATKTAGNKSVAIKAGDGDKEEVESKSKTRVSGKPGTQESPRLFKPRHFLGMGIYLIGAQMILPIEQAFLESMGLNIEFARPNLFGQDLPITTSIFLNIATLILLLFLLVKLDLLPSTLAARSAAQVRARQMRTEQIRKEAENASKQLQPTIRQGVKGEDDELYQNFRQGQRRTKKR